MAIGLTEEGTLCRGDRVPVHGENRDRSRNTNMPGRGTVDTLLNTLCAVKRAPSLFSEKSREHHAKNNESKNEACGAHEVPRIARNEVQIYLHEEMCANTICPQTHHIQRILHK